MEGFVPIFVAGKCGALHPGDQILAAFLGGKGMVDFSCDVQAIRIGPVVFFAALGSVQQRQQLVGRIKVIVHRRRQGLGCFGRLVRIGGGGLGREKPVHPHQQNQRQTGRCGGQRSQPPAVLPFFRLFAGIQNIFFVHIGDQLV